MSKLPPPSDTPRVFLHVGTLSGLDVLTVGTVAPGATVQLKDESIGVVINVKRGWLSVHPRSAQIKLQDDTITKASRRDIAEVLREAPRRTCDQAMTLTIAGTSFDQHQYDERGDVLYLSVGPPREAARTIATPEGHAVDYDETGAVIGMTLVNVQFLLDRDGMLTLSLPPRAHRGRGAGTRARGLLIRQVVAGRVAFSRQFFDEHTKADLHLGCSGRAE